MKCWTRAIRIVILMLFIVLLVPAVRAEVMLQYFNLSWKDLETKVHELSEVGYGSLWLPPPTKASGGLSVGYDLWDPFDLGNKNQRNTIRTRYGTKEDLLRLIRTAHRFGIRVYFDNIMNHRAFDVPGFNENTPIDIYPGLVPEDFHLRVTEEGFYRKWDNVADWSDTWQIQNRNFSDLIDLSQEDPNANFGTTEGSTFSPKIKFVRHPDNPEYYDRLPDGTYVGFNSTNITKAMLTNNASYYSEDTGGYLMRSIRWLVNETKLDGLRLDAVKHVPDYFFGKQFGADKDSSNDGYIGQAQWQYNMTRGFSDWDNHRDTTFDAEQARDDLMVFGEHLGEPPGFQGYIDAGMRLLDEGLRDTLNSRIGNPSSGLNGFDNAGAGGWFGAAQGVSYVVSHDNSYSDFSKRPLMYAFMVMRDGLPNIYTDGNFQAETLGDSGGAFPRHANTAFLGQFGDNRIPNLVYLHNHFGRSQQIPKWGGSDVVAWERRDKRENGAMSDADGTVLLFMMNDNFADGLARGITTTFPPGSKLWQYSSSAAGFYYTVPGDQVVDDLIIPPGGYFAFSWRSPEESSLWPEAPLMIYQNGEEPGSVSYQRRDGPDGDPAFNPYGVADSNQTDFTYTWTVPRVTSGTNLSFVSRVDGSAKNVLIRLDGGMDLNNTNHAGGDPRDNPPALANDLYLGYEQADFVKRIHREKFAARNTDSNNVIGSQGAETYIATIGSTGFVVNTGATGRDSDDYTAEFVYHDPAQTNDQGALHFSPAPDQAAGSNITVYVKVGREFEINRAFFYYTTNGTTFPEGAGGRGVDQTRTVELFFDHEDAADSTVDWWSGTVPALAAGTELRYKIGVFNQQDGSASAPWDIPFPNSDGDIARKTQMMGVWSLTNFNGETAVFRPHVDYGVTSTGLVDGFHMLKARAFLERDDRAPIFNTFSQTFYYDTEVPQGEIVFPSSDGDTLPSREYGVVLRTDPTVREVWYHIDDDDAANDDSATLNNNGNGLTTNGTTAWAQAYSVTPSLSIDSDYPDEWRFNYINVPTNGSAAIRVRLRELSSSTNLALSADEGHFGELTRTNLVADAPPQDLFFEWPPEDGVILEEGWELDVRFSKELGNGLSDQELQDSFLITINDIAQGRDAYQITRDLDGTYGQIRYAVEGIFNGDTNFLHQVEVTHETVGGVTLQTRRFIRVKGSGDQISVQITDPPEFDSDGKPFVIELPDVAAPTDDERTYTIKVETEKAADNVWITFDNDAGTAAAAPAVETAVSGTVSVVNGSDAVAGTGTLFTSQLLVGSSVRIDTNEMTIASIPSDTNLVLSQSYPGPTAAGLTLYRLDSNPSLQGDTKFWNFLWTNMTEGTFRFQANVNTNAATTNATHAQATRNISVVFRQMVTNNPADLDDDDDGIYDINETNPTNLPAGNAEAWTSGEVHIWEIYGQSEPMMPDTDGDGLPDGLEMGWRTPIDPAMTDTNADTNGDGFRNFLPDLDPPFYNTVPDNWDLPNYVFNDSRTKLIHGTMTDPANPDTDYDGIPDGIEDWNRNGWVDGDGDSLSPTEGDPNNRGAWPDGSWDSAWTETDPNNADTDGDGAGDGYGEDVNFNGWIDGDVNSNRVWDAGELWAETDPLNPDTDGDGLPDGWEKQYNLDPLNSGVIGHTNLGTGLVITNAEHGADGNPDGDTIVTGGGTNAYNNLLEFQNDTNPRFPDTGEPPPEDSIVLGPVTNPVVVGVVTNNRSFTDWKAEDVLALDEYEGDGGNNQQGDLYLGWDGWDTSRDIVAVYAKDGGDALAGGDGRFYLRVDMMDLQPLAEEGNLDLYFVIDTGAPGSGEMLLPDDVDTVTSMKWEVVVGAYSWNNGQVYVDPDDDGGLDTTTFGQDLVADGGVEVRPEYFLGSYYDATLDAVEIAINRDALTDAGWAGLDPDNLNFQVFTTKDGTCNTCNDGGPGGGDIGGRSDLRDAVYNDYIAEDYWQAQGGFQSVLGYWIGGDSRGGRAKVAMLVHGNQAIQPGSTIQDLINNGQGAGYHRVLDPHEAYNVPLNLHITPTLASAMQWARVDTNLSPTWRDGPLFNQRIGRLAATNVVRLLGSTFSDHILPYFTKEYNADNVALAGHYLETIYGTPPSTNVFWTPERVVDHDVLDKVDDLGFEYTFVDQMMHLREWYGRQSAFGNDGYRINRIGNTRVFAINDDASEFRFQNTDSGLDIALRRLVSRKARNWQQDQLVVLLSNWEDFGSLDNANAYDRNIRWIANRPWVELVAFDDIAEGKVDTNNDDTGDAWGTVDRGTPGSLPKVAKDFVHHASQEDYDNWYVGDTPLEQGLQTNRFEVRPGVLMPSEYGMMFFGGVVSSTWDDVTLVASSNLSALARGVFHASTFQTAFHESQNNDLRKYSTGDYIYPDSDPNTLASFAAVAQAQTRKAGILKRVDDWAAAPPVSSQALAEDIDADGEDEYLLYNDRLFTVFEAIGGRMVGAWVRSLLSDKVYQAAGNFHSAAGFASEQEGSYSVETNGAVVARRTSAFKDWFSMDGGGTDQYVNDLYTAVNWTNGWRFASSDGLITKTVTLDADAWDLNADYQLDTSGGNQTLFIRHGLAPNLEDLLLHGQAHLSGEMHAGGVMTLANTNYVETVSARITYATNGFAAGFNTDAVDDDPSKSVEFFTVNMRNQAQTHQVEMVGTNSFTFSLGFTAAPSDWDGDGIPNTVEDDTPGLDADDPGDGSQDADGDGKSNRDEYIANTDPNDANDVPAVSALQSMSTATGIVVEVDTRQNREYHVWYSDAGLLSPAWARATTNPISGTGGMVEWMDDGTTTVPGPFDPSVQHRFYRSEVQLPQ